MKAIFTNLAVSHYTRFFDVKPGSFMFEESNICTIKVSTEPNSVSANETISNAIGNIVKAIKDESDKESKAKPNSIYNDSSNGIWYKRGLV